MKTALLVRKIYYLWQEKYTILNLARNEFCDKYSGSSLGYLWALISPLVLAISIKIVFSNIFGVAIKNYFVLIISGIFAWIFFSDSIPGAINSFYTKKNIIRQLRITPEFIPFSIVLSYAFNWLIDILILLPVFVWVQKWHILPFILLPFYIFLFFIFSSSFVSILAFLNVWSKDVSHFVSSILVIWFWITPVFYSLEMVPFPWRWICMLNPITYYIKSFQDILFYGRIPSLKVFVISIVISAVMFFIMTYLFDKKGSELRKMI